MRKGLITHAIRVPAILRAKRCALAVALLSALLPNIAWATCSWTTLSNGTTADAAQVMNNFDCLAPIANPQFTGTVGIGMSPTESLEVAGSINATSNSANWTTGSSRAFMDYWAAGNLVRIGYAQGASGTPTGIAFYGNGGAEFFRAGSDGSLLINTTTNGGWNGNSKIAAWQPSAGQAVEAYNSSSVGTALNARVDNTAVAFAGFYYNGGSPVGSITTNGSSTSFNTTSDERLKNWRIAQRSYRDVIQQMWVGDFDWKGTGRHDFGIRAQQVYPLYPEAIHKPANDNEEMWQADYARLAPLALWGVKDVYRQQDAQDKRVEALEAQLKSQEQIISALRQSVSDLQAMMRQIKTASN